MEIIKHCKVTSHGQGSILHSALNIIQSFHGKAWPNTLHQILFHICKNFPVAFFSSLFSFPSDHLLLEELCLISFLLRYPEDTNGGIKKNLNKHVFMNQKNLTESIWVSPTK